MYSLNLRQLVTHFSIGVVIRDISRLRVNHKVRPENPFAQNSFWRKPPNLKI